MVNRCGGCKKGTPLAYWSARRRLGGLRGLNAVGAPAVLQLGRIDAQAHLLFERAAEEAAHRVSLPAGGLAEFGKRGATGPLEQAEDLGRRFWRARSLFLMGRQNQVSGLFLQPRRNFLLQFFKPVQHDVDLRRWCSSLFGPLDHQKPLAIHGNVIGRTREGPSCLGVSSLPMG